jgi:hypothetical protein
VEIADVIQLIKGCSELVHSKHFKDQCAGRNLDPRVVERLIRESKILGILEQNENEKVYKILFYLTTKDLNLIIKILPGNKIKLITVFPSKSERRQK